ncbi:unnamed protein product [Schistosoma turkestanicum]|nr:unnamed protein product [Schistosoma turkestanicum]
MLNRLQGGVAGNPAGPREEAPNFEQLTDGYVNQSKFHGNKKTDFAHQSVQGPQFNQIGEQNFIVENIRSRSADRSPADPINSTSSCPETICPSNDMSSFKGVQGENGSNEWCNRSCKTVTGITGLKGVKGSKGDKGDTQFLSFSKALQLIKYTLNITPSNYFQKGQKGDRGDSISKELIQQRIHSQNDRKLHRSKRAPPPPQQQQQPGDYDSLPLGIINPSQVNKKKQVKHSFIKPKRQSIHESNTLFTGSSFTNFGKKQKILGLGN